MYIYEYDRDRNNIFYIAVETRVGVTMLPRRGRFVKGKTKNATKHTDFAIVFPAGLRYNESGNKPSESVKLRQCEADIRFHTVECSQIVR